MRGRRVTSLAAAAALTVGLISVAVLPTPGARAASSSVEPEIEIFPTALASPLSQLNPYKTVDCQKQYKISCYEPYQIQNAYDEAPLFAKGINGKGVTIALIDAFGSPTIESDLQMFDKSFGLANPRLRVIHPAGKIPPFDATNPTMIAWASETTLDVEWAHVMAPQANILVVETPVAQTEGTAGFRQIVKAENFVVNHNLADVISQSFGSTEETLPSVAELAKLRSAYVNALFHGVTVLASSGDNGATEASNATGSEFYPYPVTNWPASDPLVTGVGGTELRLDDNGFRKQPDVVWNDGPKTNIDQLFNGNSGPDAFAGGGGKSVLFSRPYYQNSVSSVVGNQRGVPDVAMSAGCDGAVETYESFPGVIPGWYLTCGTSESTPLFAGVVALADQVAGHGLGLINPDLYRLSAKHAAGIVDITAGDDSVAFTQNGQLIKVHGHPATPGYDLASGVGTIDASALVPELAGVRCDARDREWSWLCPGGGGTTTTTSTTSTTTSTTTTVPGPTTTSKAPTTSTPTSSTTTTTTGVAGHAVTGTTISPLPPRRAPKTTTTTVAGASMTTTTTVPPTTTTTVTSRRPKSVWWHWFG